MTEWVYIGCGKKDHAIRWRIADHGSAQCGIAGPIDHPEFPFPEYGKCEKCKARLEAEKK